MTNRPRIAVAMSGGVDSSVAAALVLRERADVFGVTMRLGLAEVEGRPCCGEEEAALAARVAVALGIPHVVVDLADVFAREVVAPSLAAYAAGRTPNPCVSCNEHVKFGALAARVRELGADALATGHYARIQRDADGRAWLSRARDRAKDQSYFLYRIPEQTLSFLRFPLAELTKAEVREIAASHALPTAARRDSQEVCFDLSAAAVARGEAAGRVPGPIEDEAGAVLGAHTGIAGFTVGQRRGLGIGGPGGPYFVVRIDAERDAVVVAAEPERTRAIVLVNPIWRLEGASTAQARLRYRAPLLDAHVEPGPDHLRLTFTEPVHVPAPGQSAVLSVGDRIVGGGIIAASEPLPR